MSQYIVRLSSTLGQRMLAVYDLLRERSVLFFSLLYLLFLLFRFSFLVAAALNSKHSWFLQTSHIRTHTHKHTHTHTRLYPNYSHINLTPELLNVRLHSQAMSVLITLCASTADSKRALDLHADTLAMGIEPGENEICGCVVMSGSIYVCVCSLSACLLLA